MSETPFGIIYKALNIINGKAYIGKTIYTLEKRKNSHLVCARNGDNQVFYHAIRKYGENNFTWSIIDYGSSHEELVEKEIHWISFYRSYIHSKESNGYNMTTGGEGCIGYKHTDESKKEMSNIAKNRIGSKHGKAKKVLQYDLDGNLIKEYDSVRTASRNLNIGNSGISMCCNNKFAYYHNYIWMYKDEYSDEALSKRIKAYSRHRFRKRPILQFDRNGLFLAKFEDVKDAVAINEDYMVATIDACCRGTSCSAYDCIWIYEEDFSKEELALRLQRYKNRHQKRPVVQLSLEGEYIATFESATSASKFMGKSSPQIANCCNGKAKTAYGFIWVFEKEFKQIRELGKEISYY